MAVSIVINNYNYARYLGAAIDSALAQSEPALEVIVVDDGSTDHSRDVIEHYGARIQAIFQPNGGQAAAFNTGIRAARGEWVWLLDADDVLKPDAIRDALPLTGAGISRIAMGMETIDGGGQVTGRRIPNGGTCFQGRLHERMLQGIGAPSVPTSGNLFLREALEKILPVPEQSFRICADAYLFIMTALHGDLRIEPVVTSQYRIHGANNFHREESQPVESKALRTELNNVQLTMDLLEKYSATLPAADARRIRHFWWMDQLLLAVLRARCAGIEHAALKQWPMTRVLFAFLRCLFSSPHGWGARRMKIKQAFKIWLKSLRRARMVTT